MRHIGTGLLRGCFLILSILLLTLSPAPPAGKSQAISSPGGPLQAGACSQDPPETLPYCDDRPIVPPLITPPGGCNQLQVVILLDQSYSMQRNDPEYFRFRGANYFVNLLAYRYLEALEANIPQPEVKLVVLHFGTNVYEPNPDWVTFPPDSSGAWTKQFEQINYNVDPSEPKPGSLEATHFIDPFKSAGARFRDTGAQQKACPQRVTLLLTDGGPADGQVYSRTKLRDYMGKVKETVDTEGLVGNGNYIYVTIFHAQKDYSKEALPYWEKIATDPAAPELDDLHPVTVESNLQGITSRMKKIVSAHLGEISLPVEEWPVAFPPYLESMRVTYDDASFNIVGPDGQTYTPESGSAELVIKLPKAGSYQLTSSDPGGRTVLHPTYMRLSPQIEAPSGAQQFTDSPVRLTFLDGSGSPLKLVEDPQYELHLSAEVQQGGQCTPLSASEGGAFNGAFLPVSAQPVQVNARATLFDKQKQEETCRLRVAPAEDLPVAPVTVQVGEKSAQGCGAASYPLQVINATTRQPTALTLPVAWDVQSTTSAGSPVDASVNDADAGVGQYRLDLRADQEEPVITTFSASVSAEERHYPFFSDKLVTTGLQAQRGLAFDFGALAAPANDLSIFFNRLFNPAVQTYPREDILIGRRFFGLFGRQNVTVNGRFYDPQTNKPEPGIERFFVRLEPEKGGLPVENNAWQTGQAGLSSLLLPAPALGAYQVKVADRGEASPCVTLSDLPTKNILLINDFWEYIFWIVLLLLALALLAWLLWMLLRRRQSPPWGRLGLVDHKSSAVFWMEPLVTSWWKLGRYQWNLDGKRFGIDRIQARAWPEPGEEREVQVAVEVRRKIKDKPDERQVFRDILHPRCSYISWDSEGVWSDNENGFRLTWRSGRLTPEEEKYLASLPAVVRDRIKSAIPASGGRGE